MLFMLLMAFSMVEQDGTVMKAFTHPFSQQDIAAYDVPNGVVVAMVKSDEEAGWRVLILELQSGFFEVVIEEGGLKGDTLWLDYRDVGVIIQNYDSIPIPVFEESNRTVVRDTIWESKIVTIMDYNDELACVRYIKKEKSNEGWVSRNYFCDNPLTTCN